MKKWFAATLLVAVIAATGCNEAKKTTKPAVTPADKSAPADKDMPAPAGEKK